MKLSGSRAAAQGCHGGFAVIRGAFCSAMLIAWLPFQGLLVDVWDEVLKGN